MHRTRQLRKRLYIVDKVIWLVAEWASDECWRHGAFEAGWDDEGRRARAGRELVGCQRQVL